MVNFHATQKRCCSDHEFIFKPWKAHYICLRRFNPFICVLYASCIHLIAFGLCLALNFLIYGCFFLRFVVTNVCNAIAQFSSVRSRMSPESFAQRQNCNGIILPFENTFLLSAYNPLFSALRIHITCSSEMIFFPLPVYRS